MPEKSVLAAFRNRLGKVPDQKIADQAKVSRTLVVNYRKKLGIPAYQGHKGAAPAAKAAVEPATDRPFRGRRSALDPFLDRLGSVPDAEIAKLAGVTAENVRTYRQRRQIAPTWQGSDAPVEAAAAVSAPAVSKPAPVAPAPVAPPAPAASTPAPARPARKSRPAAEPVAAVPESPAPAPAVNVEEPAEGTPGPSAGTAFLVVIDTAQGPRNYALIASDIAAAAALAAARVPARHPDGTIRAIQRVAELLPV